MLSQYEVFDPGMWASWSPYDIAFEPLALADFYNPSVDWVTSSLDVGDVTGVTPAVAVPAGKGLLSTIIDVLKISTPVITSILQAKGGPSQPATTTRTTTTTEQGVPMAAYREAGISEAFAALSPYLPLLIVAGVAGTLGYITRK